MACASFTQHAYPSVDSHELDLRDRGYANPIIT